MTESVSRPVKTGNAALHERRALVPVGTATRRSGRPQPVPGAAFISALYHGLLEVTSESRGGVDHAVENRTR